MPKLPEDERHDPSKDPWSGPAAARQFRMSQVTAPQKAAPPPAPAAKPSRPVQVHSAAKKPGSDGLKQELKGAATDIARSVGRLLR